MPYGFPPRLFPPFHIFPLLSQQLFFHPRFPSPCLTSPRFHLSPCHLPHLPSLPSRYPSLQFSVASLPLPIPRLAIRTRTPSRQVSETDCGRSAWRGGTVPTGGAPCPTRPRGINRPPRPGDICQWACNMAAAASPDVADYQSETNSADSRSLICGDNSGGRER